MIQSRAVTGGRAGYPPAGLGNAAEVSRGARTGRTTSAASGPAGPSRRPPARRSPTRSQQRLDRRAGGVRRRLRRRPRHRRPPQAGRPGARRALRGRVGARRLRGDVLRADRRTIATACPARASPPPTRTRCSTATAAKVDTAKPRKDGSAYRVPVRIPTRAFGTVAGEVVLPATGDGIDWSRALVFPGLAAGERLRRVTRMPARATLLARDRTVLAKGDDRSSPSLLAPAGRRPAGPDPARAPRGARRARRARRRGGRRVGPRADLRRAPARHAGRRARRRRPRAQAHEPAPGPGGAHDDLAAGRAGGGHRARRAPGRHRGAPARARARCSPSPGSPSRACSRPARRSR